MKTVRVCLALICRRGEYLVVWNEPVNNWAFPGGKIEQGEKLFECMARELKEETGLGIKKQRLVYAANYNSNYGEPHIVQVNFHAVVPIGEPAGLEKNRPIGWVNRGWLLYNSPFSDFNVGLFAGLNQAGISEANIEAGRF